MTIIKTKSNIFFLRLIIVGNFFFYLVQPFTTTAGVLGNFQVSKKPTKIDQRRIVGSGTRSQCQSTANENSIELLVPKEKVAHLTNSPKPSLYYYTREEKTLNLDFTLVDPSKAQPLVETKIVSPKKGINKIDLPNSIQLESKKIYLWNLAVPCKNNPYQYQEVLTSGIERVDPQISQTQSANQSILQKIQNYTQNKIWYDSLNLAVKKSAGNSTNAQVYKTYQSLYSGSRISEIH
jgi:hypothetical protein